MLRQSKDQFCIFFFFSNAPRFLLCQVLKNPFLPRDPKAAGPKPEPPLTPVSIKYVLTSWETSSLSVFLLGHSLISCRIKLGDGLEGSMERPRTAEPLHRQAVSPTSLPHGLCELHQSTWDSLPLQPLPQFSHLRIGPLPSTVVWALITGVPVSWALVVTVQRHNTGLHQGEDFNTYRYTLEPFGGFFAAGNRAVFDPCLVAGAAMVDCHSSDWHFSSWRVS